MQHVSQIFFVSNFGINFILYCMSGQNFRFVYLPYFCVFFFYSFLSFLFVPLLKYLNVANKYLICPVAHLFEEEEEEKSICFTEAYNFVKRSKWPYLFLPYFLMAHWFYVFFFFCSPSKFGSFPFHTVYFSLPTLIPIQYIFFLDGNRLRYRPPHPSPHT